MPSFALQRWQNERIPRLTEVEAHCAAVAIATPPRTAFLDECLRGCVLHLSAHFQGYCRDLYTESTQVCIGAVPIGLQPTVQSQFSSRLMLDRGNPSYDNIRNDFERFGLRIDLRRVHPNGAALITDLSHSIAWRNRAAHQDTGPLPAGVPPVLTLMTVQQWRTACEQIVVSLDAILGAELSRVLGVAVW